MASAALGTQVRASPAARRAMPGLIFPPRAALILSPGPMQVAAAALAPIGSDGFLKGSSRKVLGLDGLVAY